MRLFWHCLSPCPKQAVVGVVKCQHWWFAFWKLTKKYDKICFVLPPTLSCAYIFFQLQVCCIIVPDELFQEHPCLSFSPPSDALTCFPAAWVFIYLSFCVCNNCDCDKLSFCAKFACFIFTGFSSWLLTHSPSPIHGNIFLKHFLWVQFEKFCRNLCKQIVS